MHPNNDLKTYQRPELTADEFQQAKTTANKISAVPRMMLSRAIFQMLLENSRLAKECNEHRAERGFEPLPITKVS